jgi:hypothetical protein
MCIGLSQNRDPVLLRICGVRLEIFSVAEKQLDRMRKSCFYDLK